MEKRKFGISKINFEENRNAKEKVFQGILGALLFGLGGGVLWVLLWQVGFIAPLAGLLTVILALNGYVFFGRKLSKRGIVLSIIISVLILIIATIVSMTLDVLTAFRDLYKAGEIEKMPTFSQAFAFGMLTIIETPSVSLDYLMYLVFGLVIGGFGAFFYLKPILAKLKEYDAKSGLDGAPDDGTNFGGNEILSHQAGLAEGEAVSAGAELGSAGGELGSPGAELDGEPDGARLDPGDN
ncbi:MAG: hypothetical protein J6X34_09135 [Clostridia bacterium]|nr:hypothetical protein [Clostridia bacterium]